MSNFATSHDLPKKPRRINFEIDMQDFGPISRGKIKLRPLTILIGPNNSGKSYTAILIGSILKSYVPTRLGRRLTYQTRGLYIFRDFDLRSLSYELLYPVLQKQVQTLKDGYEIRIPRDSIHDIMDKLFEIVYQEKLNDHLVYSFASPLKQLTRIGKTSWKLRLTFDSYSGYLICQRNKLKIKEYPRSNIRITIKPTESNIPLELKQKGHGNVIEVSKRSLQDKKELKMFLMHLIDSITDLCAMDILEKIAMPCYYLPSARSALLQSHKALIAGLLMRTSYAGIEHLEIPPLSGIIADFLKFLVELPESKGPFYRLTQHLEMKLLKGEVIMRKSGKERYPDMYFRILDTDIPLNRSSSAVSELTPLFLFLKHIIDPNCLLIIEEPEAHLHPANQRILAGFLVKLIRENVNLLITTHSEYLLQQLNTFIMLSRVDPNKRIKRYKYDRNDFLKPDEVSAYVFQYDTKTKGYKTRQLDITEEGIPQEEFGKIDELLYDEKTKLLREHINGKE